MELLDIVAVQDLLHRFWGALDDRDYDVLVAQMTPDCEWQRAGHLHHGRDEVLTAMRARPINLAIRHVITNLRVDAVDNGLRARGLLTAYMHNFADGEAGPYPGSPPAFVADTTAFCVKGNGGYLIDKLTAALVFRSAAH